MERQSEVWIDDGRGSRVRVWPPPWGADVPPSAAADARKAFELLARSAQASREEAVRRAEREMAAASRWEQRGEGRHREQASRSERRRQRAAPPMEAAAWRRWSSDFGCADPAEAAWRRATGPAAETWRAWWPSPRFSVVSALRRARLPTAAAPALTAARPLLGRTRPSRPDAARATRLAIPLFGPPH